jgi:hypothetical protein
MSSAIKALYMTCPACPSSWEGTLLDGRAIYIRYRWGFLRATAGKTMNEAVQVGTAAMLAHIKLARWWENGLLDDNPERTSELFEQIVRGYQDAAEDGEYLFGKQIGDELDGILDTHTMLHHLREVGITKC